MSLQSVVFRTPMVTGPRDRCRPAPESLARRRDASYSTGWDSREGECCRCPGAGRGHGGMGPGASSRRTEVTDERTSADVDRLLDDAEALTLKALYELPDEQIEQALDGLNRLILALRRMKIRRREGKKGPEVELTHAELRVQLKETIEELRALGDTVTVVRTETDESVTIL